VTKGMDFLEIFWLRAKSVATGVSDEVTSLVGRSSALATDAAAFACVAFLAFLTLFVHVLLRCRRDCLALFLNTWHRAVRGTTRSSIAEVADADCTTLEETASSQACQPSARSLERAPVVAEAASSTASRTRVRARQLVAGMSGMLAAPAVRVTAASAATGAAALGVAGGAVGATTGGIVGGTFGIVPALFTFGLSIPIGAAAGSVIGLCVGTTVGGATGLVGGGTVGYGVYLKREEIQSCAMETASRLGVYVEHVQARAWASKEFAKEQASTAAASFRSRIAGTGGSPSES